MVIVLTLHIWNTSMRRSCGRAAVDGSQRGEDSVTHRGLSAQLQALLQVQLVALGGYDGPAGEK